MHKITERTLASTKVPAMNLTNLSRYHVLVSAKYIYCLPLSPFSYSIEFHARNLQVSYLCVFPMLLLYHEVNQRDHDER